MENINTPSLSMSVQKKIEVKVYGIGNGLMDQEPDEEYCWSGYADNKVDFMSKNFSQLEVNGHSYICCLLENSVALCEFIDLYISESNIWEDLHDCLSPGMALWFSIGYEGMACQYSEIPDWCRNIIDCYCNSKLMIRTKIEFENTEYEAFLFNEVDIIDSCIDEIDKILTSALSECEAEQ